MNSVIPAISQSLVYVDTASQAWEDLRARFVRADRVRVSFLQRDMYALRQDSCSVTEFFTKLKGFWEELELYRPIPQCTCTFRCMCEAMRNAKKFKEEGLVLLFLTGLDDRYAMVRSQILLMEPFPQLNAAFGLVIQHESLNDLENLPAVLDNPASINVAQKSYGKNPVSSKSDKVCTYCHKNNHICFKKHGFPPGYRFKDGTLAVNKHKGQASANHVASEDSGIQNAVDTRVPTFTTEEYQALMALLKSNSNNASAGPSQVNIISKVIASSYCNDRQEDDWFG